MAAPLGCLPSLLLGGIVCVFPKQAGTAGPPLWEPLVKGMFTTFTRKGAGYGGQGSATPTMLALRPGQVSEGRDPAPAVQLGLAGGWAGGACSWFHGLRINREARAVKAGPPSASWMSPSPELLLCLSHVSLRTGGMAHACLHRTCVQKCT